MTKKSGRAGDAFARNKIEGEYENPGPRLDPAAQAIAGGLSKLSKREKTGFVTRWLPIWAKRAKLPPFSLYFFDDKLAVDLFGRDREELDALDEDLTPAQRQEVSHKTVLCSEHGVAYLSLGPDDELDMTQLAAKMGKTSFKKGSKQVSRTGAASPTQADDGITEEGD